eukprot:TRINITY_DN5937_c0_g2_i1.p2 TRINITY_DN5937_c0_g2~~TRINITY_DN5937_c0_g2_i1.p2  ORF type:complete len:117 (-),score=17.74 TRINITY_DN5937_c0_g2_i1:22-372(-)
MTCAICACVKPLSPLLSAGSRPAGGTAPTSGTAANDGTTSVASTNGGPTASTPATWSARTTAAAISASVMMGGGGAAPAATAAAIACSEVAYNSFVGHRGVSVGREEGNQLRRQLH